MALDHANTNYALVPLLSQARNDKPEQQWYLQDDKTKIQLAGTTLCMDAGAKGKYCLGLRNHQGLIRAQQLHGRIWLASP